MVLIENVFIEKPVFTTKFKCDLERCKGSCCSCGPGRTPLTNMEAILLRDYSRKIQIPRQVVEKNSSYYHMNVDSEGSCILSYGEKGKTLCSLHPHNRFLKPSYCRLFPLVIEKRDNFHYLKLEVREMCESAYQEENEYIWEFLSEYLIFQFGKKWYNVFTSIFKSQFA